MGFLDALDKFAQKMEDFGNKIENFEDKMNERIDKFEKEVNRIPYNNPTDLAYSFCCELEGKPAYKKKVATTNLHQLADANLKNLNPEIERWEVSHTNTKAEEARIDDNANKIYRISIFGQVDAKDKYLAFAGTYKFDIVLYSNIYGELADKDKFIIKFSRTF